jgi:dTDP-4-amino-4,6-dideoxygalactose transaminase
MQPASDNLPALLAGTPVRPQGPPPWPQPDDAVRLALEAAYQDGSWGKYHGPHVERLESVLREYHGTSFALTCSSGTLAVELALRALKVGPGDEVVLAAYDYPGNFLGVHAVGAHPVLVDLDPESWNLSPKLLESALGPRTRAVIASHLHGGVVSMRELMPLARAHDVAVVEDAAQMPGAMIKGKKAGAWGDVAVLSFGGSKLLTAGRGGALLTSRPEVYQRARNWLQRGNNLTCPLSELQAAVLLPQLDKLDSRNTHRAQNVRLLLDMLKDIPGLRPFVNHLPDTQPGYYKLGFQYDATAFGLSRSRFLEAIRAEGIAMDDGFPALHTGRSPRRFRAPGPLLEADRAGQAAIVLHHPVLLGAPTDLAQVAEAMRKIQANLERLR